MSVLVRCPFPACGHVFAVEEAQPTQLAVCARCGRACDLLKNAVDRLSLAGQPSRVSAGAEAATLTRHPLLTPQGPAADSPTNPVDHEQPQNARADAEDATLTRHPLLAPERLSPGSPTNPGNSERSAAVPDGANAATQTSDALRPPVRRSSPADADAWMPERIGRFALRERLGEGAFGVVYRAFDPQLDREVALKVAKPREQTRLELDEQFVTEARSAAQLRHPNIVPVFDAGKDGHQFFIAAAFINGQTLASAAEERRYDVRRSVQIVRQLAEALAYAHHKGIVHRDVKPANVMLDEQGDALLTDFGLAARNRTADDPSALADYRGMGTPAYMAPEQKDGRAVAASDQYSLGCTFYQLLTGQTPFAGPPSLQLFLHAQKEVAPPRRLNPRIARDLEAVCLKCLAKQPAARYQDCLALADDLRRWLDGDPVTVRRAPAWERTIRWARRRPAQAAFTGVSVLLLAVFVFAVAVNGLYQSAQARYQTQQAGIFREKAERLEKSELDRKMIEQQWLKARKLMSEGNWGEAQTELVAAQHALGAQHDLQAADLQAEIRQSLEVVVQHVREDQLGQQARARWRDLWKPYDDAWFHETLSTGLEPIENRDRARACARAALAQYRLDGGRDRSGRLTALLEQDQAHLGADEHAQVVRACYELLLIWAQAEAITLPEEAVGPDEVRRRALRGLEVLGMAEQLGRGYGLDTQAFHRRRALYLALSRGEKFAAASVTTGPKQPAGVLDWFLRAMDSYLAGRTEEASLACGEVLRRQEGHFWAHYLRGLCRLRSSQWLEAHAELTVCRNQKKHVWPVLLDGFAASERGYQLRQALDTGALQLAGTLVSAAPPLGAALPALAAAGVLATRVRPGDAEFAEARDDFDRALAAPDLGPQARYVALVNRGTLLIRQENWDDAIADLTQATKLNPKAYQAQFNLAMALRGARRPQEALAALDQAIACEPGLDVLYASRALLQSDQARAQADLERAVDSSSQEGRPERLANNLLQLGRLLLAEGKHQQALASFDRVVQAKPDLLVAQRFRAEALLALGRSAEAGQALDRYLELTRQPAPEVLLARGLIHARAGQLPQAIEMFSAKLRLTPHDTLTRSDRGWTYLQTDALRLALQDFEACLLEQPDNADFLIGRGVARIRLKQWAEALADAEKAEKEARLTERPLYNLACLYAQAAGQAEAEARARRDPRASQGFVHYAEKASDCLARSLGLLSEEKRAAFWRKQVQIDPLLAPLRRERAYLALAARYGGGDL